MFGRSTGLLLAGVVAVAGVARSDELAVEIEVRQSALSAGVHERITTPISLRNLGTEAWASEPPHPIHATYHLLGADGSMIAFDNVRTVLPRRVEAGEAIVLELRVEAPGEPADYLLEIDLVKEEVTWFEGRGSKTIHLPLSVSAPFESWQEPTVRLEEHGSEFEWWLAGQPELNALQLLIKQTIAMNRTEFRFGASKIHGFSAGTTYPQIWIRDNATVLPTSRYLLGERYLTSWILAHLAAQAEDGSLHDFIDAKGGVEKNTTEADQEASLVDAAWIASQVLGADWLQERVRGQLAIDRLERSLRHLLEQRRDPESGLIENPHTADWGDVSPEFSDQRAVDVHASSRFVVGIYTQAMAYQAMSQLADLLDGCGEPARAGSWRREALRIAEQSRRLLWDDQRGFFRIHRHVDYPAHTRFAEPNMFAMGGNAVAILSGLATPQQSLRIVAEARRRRELFGISTISGVMLPPYPEGFFPHPSLDGYYEYQNGGQWDWFGGRLVLGMYRLGDASATDELSRIARKAVSNRGLFEWDTTDGRGRGSAHYAGSAGVLGRAVIEGLFGIEWSSHRVTVTPRLGSQEGYVYLPQRSTSQFLSYHYEPCLEAPGTKLRIVSNLDPGVWLRLPTPVAGGRVREVRVSGRSVAFEPFSEGAERGIVLGQPVSKGVVQVRYQRR